MGNLFTTTTVNPNSWDELLQQPYTTHVLSSATFQLATQCNYKIPLTDDITPALVHTSHVTEENMLYNHKLTIENNIIQDITMLREAIDYVKLHQHNVSYRELLDLIKIHANGGFTNIKVLLTVLIQFAEQCVYDNDTSPICAIIDHFLYQIKNTINAYALLLFLNVQLIPYVDGTENTEMILLASRSFTFKNICKVVTDYPYDIKQCYKDKNNKIAKDLIQEIYYHTDINFQCGKPYYSDFSLADDIVQQLSDVSNLPRLLIHYMEHSISKDNWLTLQQNWLQQIEILSNVRQFLQNFKLKDIIAIDRNNTFPILAFYATTLNDIRLTNTVTHFAIPATLTEEQTKIWQKNMTDSCKIIYY